MAKSLDAVFRPRSVAVVGASTKRGTLGREIFDKLLEFEFNGPVYPVNPKAEYVHSVKAYARIKDIPAQVDLALIVVRKDIVLAVVKECAECGVKGIVVVTAGFRETGEKGAELEQQIVDVVKSHNMRMIGPNCMGVINTEAEVRLDATFAPISTLPGNVAMVSQSGALGQTILEHALDLNLGVSMFASVGNKADVSGNDLLDYWKDDASVEVILMYLESFGDPRKFIQLAKEVSRKKPMIIVKSGRTSAGARAATSHTGALAGMDVAYDALFEQCGVLRANTINEMFDFAMGFANVPLPRGNRVAIITNAGGPGIIAADACESVGLEVTELAESTRHSLKEGLIADASVRNPVDLLAGARPEEFQFALKQVLKDDNVDAAIVIFVAPIITDPTAVARNISEVVQNFDKPVLGCFMGVKGVATGVEELHRQRVPAYPFPESAARTLAAMAKYQRWLQRAADVIHEYEVEKGVAKEVIARALKENREHLRFDEIESVLRAYGIPFVTTKLCDSLEEILDAATSIKYPVSLKVSSEQVVHKSDVGGVKLNLRNEEELSAAYHNMLKNLKSRGVSEEGCRFVVQEMLEPGREVIVGIHVEPKFGPLVMFGLGGIYVEVLHDVNFKIVPLSATDAEEMIKTIKGFPILAGIRGESPVNFDLIKEMLLRLSQLADDLPVAELDLNPVLVHSERSKCKAVDARMRVQL